MQPVSAGIRVLRRDDVARPAGSSFIPEHGLKTLAIPRLRLRRTGIRPIRADQSRISEDEVETSRMPPGRAGSEALAPQGAQFIGIARLQAGQLLQASDKKSHFRASEEPTLSNLTGSSGIVATGRSGSRRWRLRRIRQTQRGGAGPAPPRTFSTDLPRDVGRGLQSPRCAAITSCRPEASLALPASPRASRRSCTQS
jgi:hypothetical protein